MFEYLRIKNLALIADMELEFDQGMNVLTGETGAGKSFILKAINFLMGDKLGADLIRQGKEKAQIEAIFTYVGIEKEEELILRRELSLSTGRSRFYVNDTLSSYEVIKELRPKLLTHISQHGQQKLLQPSYQEKLIDAWVDQTELFTKKEHCIEKFKELLNKHAVLIKRSQEVGERRDLLELYLQDINKVNPLPNEDEQLEAIKEDIRITETIQKSYIKALQLLQGEEPNLLNLLAMLEKQLEIFISLDPDLLEYYLLVEDFRQKFVELERKLRSFSYSKTGDMDSEEIESRLFELSQLKRKLHRSLPEIFLLKEEVESNLSFLDVCALDIRQIEKEQNILFQELQQILYDIKSAREIAAQLFCKKLKEELMLLGFSEYAEVIIDFIPYEIFPDCIDYRVRFFWAPNPGHPPQPLERIASGGELSRFLLAVVSMQTSKEDGMLIFDEIDAGVGGKTLHSVADKLATLACHKQLLVITHWSQIALKASRHFQIVKDIHDNTTYTRCKQLSDADKQLELSRMSGIILD